MPTYIVQAELPEDIKSFFETFFGVGYIRLNSQGDSLIFEFEAENTWEASGIVHSTFREAEVNARMMSYTLPVPEHQPLVVDRPVGTHDVHEIRVPNHVSTSEQRQGMKNRDDNGVFFPAETVAYILRESGVSVDPRLLPKVNQ